MTAIEARTHLIQLEAERALATDLDDEIEALRHAYVGAAVTEIASLRGELFGPQFG